MRTAFVFIPRLPCAVEVQRDPALAGRPLIVGDADQPKRTLACSEEAAAWGVRPGMSVREALGLCPGAVVLPPDPVLYGARWEAALDALAAVSPEVEDDGLGRAYVNVEGMSGHYQEETALAARVIALVRETNGLAGAVGLAAGKFPAFAAAAGAPAGEARVVAAGQEASFLAPLPVELLPMSAEVVSRLRLFGLETIGEVAALSLPELQSQFGREGERLWQLANGRDASPLRPRPAVEKVEARLSFEAPVAGVEVMVAAAKQLLSRLRPTLRGRAARELVLQAELLTGRGWERRIVLREAVSDGERLAFVLRSSLLAAPPPNAVRSLSLRLAGLTGETGKQLSLDGRARLQRQLEEAVRQLKTRYGASPIYRCLDVEAWSVIPEERQILVESDA